MPRGPIISFFCLIKAQLIWRLLLGKMSGAEGNNNSLSAEKMPRSKKKSHMASAEASMGDGDSVPFELQLPRMFRLLPLWSRNLLS